MKRSFSKGVVLALLIGLCVSAGLTTWAQASLADERINVNTASLAELQKLPRIGPKVAQRILDYRKEHGPFKRIEDLMKVKGIGEKIFAGLKDKITVGAEAQPKS